jgi:hypothetical protein
LPGRAGEIRFPASLAGVGCRSPAGFQGAAWLAAIRNAALHGPDDYQLLEGIGRSAGQRQSQE